MRVVRDKLLGVVEDIRRQMEEPLSRSSMVILRESMDSLLLMMYEWDRCYRDKVYFSSSDFEKSYEMTQISNRLVMLMIDLTSKRLSRFSSENIDVILDRVETMV